MNACHAPIKGDIGYNVVLIFVPIRNEWLKIQAAAPGGAL